MLLIKLLLKRNLVKFFCMLLNMKKQLSLMIFFVYLVFHWGSIIKKYGKWEFGKKIRGDWQGCLTKGGVQTICTLYLQTLFKAHQMCVQKILTLDKFQLSRKNTIIRSKSFVSKKKHAALSKPDLFWTANQLTCDLFLTYKYVTTFCRKFLFTVYS